MELEELQTRLRDAEATQAALWALVLTIEDRMRVLSVDTRTARQDWEGLWRRTMGTWREMRDLVGELSAAMDKAVLS